MIGSRSYFFFAYHFFVFVETDGFNEGVLPGVDLLSL